MKDQRELDYLAALQEREARISESAVAIGELRSHTERQASEREQEKKCLQEQLEEFQRIFKETISRKDELIADLNENLTKASEDLLTAQSIMKNNSVECDDTIARLTVTNTALLSEKEVILSFSFFLYNRQFHD